MKVLNRILWVVLALIALLVGGGGYVLSPRYTVSRAAEGNGATRVT